MVPCVDGEIFCGEPSGLLASPTTVPGLGHTVQHTLVIQTFPRLHCILCAIVMPATSSADCQAQLAAAAYLLYWYLMLLQRILHLHDLHVLYRWCRHRLWEGAEEAGGQAGRIRVSGTYFV